MPTLSPERSPITRRLKLVFNATAALAADVGLIVVRPAIFSLVNERIDLSAAEVTRDLVPSAVSANSLAGLELGEGRTVDAQSRRSQQGDRVTVQRQFPHIERRNAAVPARRNFVLTAQLQDLLGGVREGLGLTGAVVVGSLSRIITR